MLRYRLCLIAILVALLVTLTGREANAATGDCIAIEFTIAGDSQCEIMKRTTDQAIQDGWVIRRIDPKQEPHLAARYQVQNFPTTVLVRNGREMDRVVGAVSLAELRKRLIDASSVDTVKRDLDRTFVESPKIRGQSAIAMVPTSSSEGSRRNIGQADSMTLSTMNSKNSNALEMGATANRKDLREATVRIRVEEPQQEGVGTGTIIDSHNGEALVLTCGHLFRDSQGKTKITVETFIGGQVQSYPAVLIDFQAKEMDIGLLSFRPATPVSVATLIPKNRKFSEGQTVSSWGCDRGAEPSRRDSRISKLNRYLGPPNVEVEGTPVEGRSGGGLFDDRGELIGVCYAADHKLNEGLYNSAEVVYYELAKLGLQRLFNDRNEDAMPNNGRERDRVASAVVPVTSTPTAAPQELTVIVKDANGGQEQIYIPQPSPQLLQALREQARR